MVVGVVLACVAVVVWLVVGSLGRGDTASVDELPTVAEVIAAQAHAHGVSIPSEAPLPSGEPSAASTLSGFTQMSRQLVAVADADGVDTALAILHDAAMSSPEVAAECTALYDVVRGRTTASVPSLSQVCPRP